MVGLVGFVMGDSWIVPVKIAIFTGLLRLICCLWYLPVEFVAAMPLTSGAIAADLQ